MFYVKLSLIICATKQVAEHYEQVVATDVSEVQLERATLHPRIRYLHTPLTTKDDELVSLIGGENSVDLITVAQAIHWFDLPKFYALASRLLRKPGGIIAVWCYRSLSVSPTFDAAMKAFSVTTLPFWDANANIVFDEYKTLPFPFESVGLGSEGSPLVIDIPKELSFEGFLRMVGSLSAVATAKSQGVDLLTDEVVQGLESAWGSPKLVRTITYKGFVLAGKV